MRFNVQRRFMRTHYNMRMVFRNVLLLLCMAGPALAQEPQITSEMNVEVGTLHNWLHSGDPRLIAWAGDFARRRHNAEILSEIPGMLEHWSMLPKAGGNVEESAQRRAILNLLDGIIQDNVKVSLPAIERIADVFPAQAVLLIQRLPMEESRLPLMMWAFDGNDSISSVRARTAAMMLAKNPDPDFVSRVLGGFVQHVTIQIVSPKSVLGGMGSGGPCGDSLGTPLEAGWPQVYAYSLFEDDTGRKISGDGIQPVVEIGRHSISAVRRKESAGWEECSSQQTDAQFRHELIAYWLGVTPSEMQWKPYESTTVKWSTKAAYERELGAWLEADRVRMSGVLQQLRERGLLGENIAYEKFPQISVRIECHLYPCPLRDLSNSPH
jgi:hypothetical protein